MSKRSRRRSTRRPPIPKKKAVQEERQRREHRAAEFRRNGDYRRAQMCARKNTFKNEYDAIGAALTASVKFAKPFRTYECPYCGKYHIASAAPQPF